MHWYFTGRMSVDVKVEQLISLRADDGILALRGGIR
jgi:hypothetical protein